MVTKKQDLFGKACRMGDRLGVVTNAVYDDPVMVGVIWVRPDRTDWVNFDAPEKVNRYQLTILAHMPVKEA